MKFRITMDTDNAYFRGDGDPDFPEDMVDGAAIADILTKLAGSISESYFPDGGGGILRDINGNTVGMWSVSDD